MKKKVKEKKVKGRKVFLTNYESRTMQQQRNIEYWLEKKLPKDWKEMSENQQGIWINNNAEFIEDDFEEPHYDELTIEETVDIQWDENND